MCGIFGYANFHKSVSRRRIFDTLLGGLKKIEYRGYDSAGLCVMDDEGRPFVLRSVGNINALREKVDSQEVQNAIAMDAVLSDHVGLAHTRWATHGEVCERNCHPQQSNHGEFTVVHNGIMTNFTTVKQLLLSEGYTFTSDTDTEVIAVLAQYIYAKKPCTFVELASQLTHFVEGAYALLLTSQHFPGELIACRKGSPLVVGVRSENTTEKNTTIDAPTLCKEGSSTVRPRKYTIFSAPEADDAVEVFFSSDCNAFAEYTKDVIYLEDNDVVHYSDGQLQFFTASKMLHEVVSRECHVLEMTLESLSKGNYEHFMLKEIFEQSETVVSSMRGRIDFANGEVHLGGFSAQNVHHILNSRRLLFVSCGTSLNSCFAVRPLLEELLAIPVGVENASDFMDRDGCVNRSDTVFFVSQSGETADTLMALQRCRDNGALCVGITNVVGSSISRLTDFGAHLNAGAEVGVASTKAYTSQVVLLTLIALLLSADSRRAEKRRQEVVKGLMDLPNNLTKVLKSMDAPIGALASKLKDSRSIIILGRGFDYATCIEAALKIKELTYIHTEGINSGELKHGPLALVDEDMTVMALCSQDKHADKCKAAVQQVRARKGNLIVFSTARDAELEEAATGGFIELPQTVDCLQCVVNIVPFQLLSYYMALQRGNNVDCPRNLAKSVTVQ